MSQALCQEINKHIGRDGSGSTIRELIGEGARFRYPRVGTLMIHLYCDCYGYCSTHYIGAS
jgi:hypothetical protein